MAGERTKQFTVRDISELVRQGQDLMVQVVKDPLGTKGAPDHRYHAAFSLSGVYARASHVGVSQRIENESEHERLKKWSEYCDEQGRFIIRTAAEGLRLNWPPMPLI